MTNRLKLGLDSSFMMEFDPDYTLKYPIQAEKVGFDYLWMGDHYLPWHASFQQSFFVWELLAVIASKTRKLIVGPDVTVPIGARYHPAIIAQAAGTMERMFPGRFVLGVGSGEAINESWFMGRWPKWSERMERTLEGVALIRQLWERDDYFSYKGKYFALGTTKLYVKGARPPPIYLSAIGPRAAYLAGKHADRLISSGNAEDMRTTVFPNFEKGAREVGKDPSRIDRAVLMNMATGPEDKVVDRMHRLIAGASISAMVNEGDPRNVEKAGRRLPKKAVRENVIIFNKPDEVIDAMEVFRKLGATQVIVSEMSVEPEKAMAVYSKVAAYYKGK